MQTHLGLSAFLLSPPKTCTPGAGRSHGGQVGFCSAPLALVLLDLSLRPARCTSLPGLLYCTAEAKLWFVIIKIKGRVLTNRTHEALTSLSYLQAAWLGRRRWPRREQFREGSSLNARTSPCSAGRRAARLHFLQLQVSITAVAALSLYLSLGSVRNPASKCLLCTWAARVAVRREAIFVLSSPV